MKIQSLYSRPEDDPKKRKNPDAVRPAPSPLGLAALGVGGGGSSGGSSITINNTNGTVPYRTGATTFADSPLTVNAPAGTGIAITSAAAGSGVTVGVTSSGSNESLILAPKGSGSLLVNLASGTADKNSILVTDSATTGTATVFRGYGSAATYIGFTVGRDASRYGTFLWDNSASAFYFQTFSNAFPLVFQGSKVELTSQVMMGLSGSSTDAQLSVYSQSATRPGLKLRAVSGTAGSQNVFESYDASGTPTLQLTAGGGLSAAGIVDGAASLRVGSTNFIASSTGIVVRSDATVAFAATTGVTGAVDVILARDAANTLAQRNSTNAQTFRIYETYTDGSNYERLEINASATTNTIKPAAAGTGTASKIDYYLTPTVFISSGTGSPEGVLTAGIGSMYARTDGGAATSFYVKESGTGNTGWVAK